MGEHPGFVQLMLAIRTSEPLGRRKYWKMYEAAEAHGLPIGIHFGGQGGYPITGAGWPSYYVEDHAGMSTAFQAQVISYITEGVFEQFPNLKIVLIEGGFAWLPVLGWRLDAAWKKLKAEVPHLKRAPSEYLEEHFWVTTQPMEEPPEPEQFLEMLEHGALDAGPADVRDRLPALGLRRSVRGAAEDQAAGRLRGEGDGRERAGALQAARPSWPPPTARSPAGVA